jgi:hypothetical protein
MNITFTVTINYTHEDVNGVICPESMRDNLYDELYQACLERWNRYDFQDYARGSYFAPENIEVSALEVSLNQQEQTK